MDLKTHFSTLERGKASAIAKEMKISLSYLWQLVNQKAPISPARAVQFEQILNGAVTRKDMFPDDWESIWPELASEKHQLAA